MGRYLDLIKSAAEEEPSSTIVLTSLAELSPIVNLDHISEIVDGLEAKFLGVKARGWLPESEPAIREQSVLAELVRVLPDLIRHAWPLAVRVRLLARLQPGDRIVKVDDEFLLVTARPPRECYRVYRHEA
jgi:hypothetical protein